MPRHVEAVVLVDACRTPGCTELQPGKHFSSENPPIAPNFDTRHNCLSNWKVIYVPVYVEDEISRNKRDRSRDWTELCDHLATSKTVCTPSMPGVCVYTPDFSGTSPGYRASEIESGIQTHNAAKKGHLLLASCALRQVCPRH